MSIKQRWGAALIAAALVAAFVPAMAADSKQGVLLDRIVAIVNNDVILMSELEQQVDLARRSLRSQGTPVPPTDDLRHQVLQKMIATELQLQLAERQGIRISDDYVNGALAHIAQQNGFTLSEMPARLAAQGLDYNQFRQHIRDELIQRRVHEKQVENRVVVSPAEVDQFLVQQAQQGRGNTQYHVYQILLKVPPDATEAEAEKIHQQAETVYQKLKNGADFQATAAAMSDGRNALKGGNLGWLRGGELPASLANAVLTMDEGSISEPIRDEQGYHIVKLAEERAQQQVIVTQTHARHILIQPNLLVSNSEAEQRLQDLREKIKNGASFEKLAKEYSDDTQSASKGGDLGWLDPGMVVPRFQQVMDQMKKNEISQPFETQFGWHIVQVLDRRKQNQTEETRRNHAFQAIRARKMREQTDRWLRQLREQAYIKIQLDEQGGNDFGSAS
ncbi:MAG TPA: peptidylprolyl isomerase [Gammaproteobacteria bacterium]|nr:peptidylprolyl isomerase [Gammaproteobacteria bacterium]